MATTASRPRTTTAIRLAHTSRSFGEGRARVDALVDADLSIAAGIGVGDRVTLAVQAAAVQLRSQQPWN